MVFRLYFFNLKEIKLYRGRPSEYTHHDLQLSSFRIDLVDDAGEVGEGAVGDLDVLADGDGAGGS